MVEKQTGIPYNFENTPTGLDRLCEIIKHFIDTLDVDKSNIININLNISGRVNPKSGYSYSRFNFEEQSLADVLTRKIGIKSCIENDTRAMTLGEYTFGNCSNEKNVIFVNIGWGLGIGMILDGKIYRGKSGFAGELGHMVTFNNEIMCHCGKKGCLQTYISESWLIKTGQLLFNSSPNNILRSLVTSENDITIETIIKAYELGDSYFTTKIDQGLKLLSTSIANTLIIQDSDKIYLNSKLFCHLSFKNQIISQIQEQLNFIPTKRNIDIEITQFDNFRGAKGAAALAAFTFFIKSPNFEYHT